MAFNMAKETWTRLRKVAMTAAGYLISASSNLLSLWQCSCSYDEPALQLIHQLDSEFYASDLQLGMANKVLLAAARDTKTSAECVAVHHLRMSHGIFRLQGRLALPVGAAAAKAKGPAGPKATQVPPSHPYHLAKDHALCIKECTH